MPGYPPTLNPASERAMSTTDDVAKPELQQSLSTDDEFPSGSEDTSASRRRDLSPEECVDEGGANRVNEVVRGEVSIDSTEPTRPIAVTTPIVPSDDDGEFVPRGKVTQTLVGGGKKGGRPR